MQWEREARDARRGLWLSDNPKKPWEWKRDHPRNAKKQDCIQVYLIIDAAN
jgi:endonuclease YncB( thermonuclease family)